MTLDDNQLPSRPIKSHFLEREMLASFLLGVLYFYPIRCREKENQEMDARVVGEEYSFIADFPYSALLGASCKENWICGASILNQYILLTAAHCLHECVHKRSSILVKFGSAGRHIGSEVLAQRFVTHANYSERRTEYDIGLLKLKESLQFSRSVGRVAVMRNPPYNELGKIAGWGRVNEMNRSSDSIWLKHITQIITRRKPCQKLIGALPVGVICGGALGDNKFISNGDSGSGLVVQGYIQVGIVSFKRIDVSISLAIYTDVGYYYKWIKTNAMKLYCGVRVP